MSYVEGLVLAVPNAKRDTFASYAERFYALFIEHGAHRFVLGWGDNVPVGKRTDLNRAVECAEDETVVFGWIEWPDKAARDRGMKSVMDDERMKPHKDLMPYDGSRMIVGGFSTLVDLRPWKFPKACRAIVSSRFCDNDMLKQGAKAWERI